MNMSNHTQFGKTAAMLLLASVMSGLGIGSAGAAPEGSPWGGDYFPNVVLQTQDGKSVRFYDDVIKNKVVAINFIFTHCSDSCPLETANLHKVEKLLGDRFGKDVFFYSISIDGQSDTPADLKAYAKKFNAGPGWTFLTGNQADVTLIRKKLGLYRDDAEGQKQSSHSISFMVGNEATGQWIKRSPFDNPNTLAHLLGYRLANVQKPQSGRVSYAQAPQLPVMSKGEDLFHSRCESCHSLDSKNAIGPGLAGVTHRRAHAWLARWIKEPDRMLAEKDPVSKALFEQYNQVAMPNLRLDDTEVEALIEFLESARDKTLAQH